MNHLVKHGGELLSMRFRNNAVVRLNEMSHKQVKGRLALSLPAGVPRRNGLRTVAKVY